MGTLKKKNIKFANKSVQPYSIFRACHYTFDDLNNKNGQYLSKYVMCKRTLFLHYRLNPIDSIILL